MTARTFHPILKGGLLLFFLFCTLSGKAQSIITTELPGINQLPTKEVLCIFQDSEGYMWYGTEGGLCRNDGYRVKVFRSDFNTPELLESNSITGIAEDNKRNIWFGTKRGMYILDKKTYQISPLSDEEIKGWAIKMVNTTSDGSIWVLSGKTLFRYNASKERLGKYELQWENTIKEPNCIYEDHKGTIWVVQMKGGIFRYDPSKDHFIPYPWPYTNPATCMVKDATHAYYWVGTWGEGIVRFNPEEKDPNRMFMRQSAPHTSIVPDKNRIHHIAQDSVNHHLWISTTDNLYAYEITEHSTLREVNTSAFLSGEKRLLSGILCDRAGNIWLTGNFPDSHSFVMSYLPSQMTSDPMNLIKEKLGIEATPMGLYHEKNYYWVRQKRTGLYVCDAPHKNLLIYDSRNRSISFFFEKAFDQEGVYVALSEAEVVLIQYKGTHLSESSICTIPVTDSERIRTLHDDTQGNLWIGTTYNLFKYNLRLKKLDRINEKTGIINKITSLKNGKVYIATESEGFWEITNGKKSFQHISKENYSVLAISPDHKVWVGTQQGNLYCYDPIARSFTSRTEKCGLIGDAILDLSVDNFGNIWIVTNQKITVYNPEKEIINQIRCSDPSVSLDNFLCLYKGTKGEIHAGGTGGVLVFPSINQFGKAAKDTRISLTSVRINNIQQLLDGDNHTIILDPQERNVELFFSTFDPLNANKIRYAFRQKKDQIWNYLPMGQNNIYLAGLSKGKYEIEVRATDRNGLWSKNTTTILVQCLPAWYETWWAYSLYALVLLAIAGFVIQRYIRSQKNRQQKEMEEQISQMKYRFFTNVSHELRTPLTLIITPLEAMVRKVSDNKIRQQLESIHRNALNLLSLVNQLLDFRKVEMGGETLSLTKGNINEFVSSVYENFQQVSEEKNIDFSYHTEVPSLYMFFDANKLRKVINNLLSNAFKFTGEGGSISISIREESKEGVRYIVISVKDTGKGIPADALSTIFERFYQVSGNGQEHTVGSGIGLHLVKEYVHMHSGNVTVQSEPGKGSVFSIHIPADLNPIENLPISETEEAQEELPTLQPKADLSKKLLIVEDNTEFRTYLKSELSLFYTVYEAADGLEGEREASEKEPDIIITDLMMPGIDGIELCHRIKNNIHTSHIPVILLTANNNIENEKRGYKEGADAFISKPFHWEILLSRVENLIAQKVQRQQTFEKETEINPKELTISSLDEKLIQKTLELIETNLNNSEYSIEDLSSDMCMSRSNLYRKIHSITGLTPTDFIKNIRLKKAAELLKDGELSVVEVAYTVGFNTPSYFTKSFKKMFGVLPTQYNQRK